MKGQHAVDVKERPVHKRADMKRAVSSGLMVGQKGRTDRRHCCAGARIGIGWYYLAFVLTFLLFVHLENRRTELDLHKATREGFENSHWEASRDHEEHRKPVRLHNARADGSPSTISSHMSPPKSSPHPPVAKLPRAAPKSGEKARHKVASGDAPSAKLSIVEQSADTIMHGVPAEPAMPIDQGEAAGVHAVVESPASPAYAPPDRPQVRQSDPVPPPPVPAAPRPQPRGQEGATADDEWMPFPPRFPIQHRTTLDARTIDMCKKTLWNTRDTTVTFLDEDNSTFVITGDINDLWVRDSCAQVHPYIRFTPTDPKMARLIEGLIRRLAFYILYDPYANAFRIDTSYVFSENQKLMGRHGYISTWEFELDSGAYFFRLLWTYWKHMPGAQVFMEENILKAINLQLNVWETEQHHEDREEIAPGYHRLYRRPAVRPMPMSQPWTGFPGLARDGKGSPCAYTGMVWSGFRPSDDEQKYGYLVPSNMFAVVGLTYVAEMASRLWQDSELEKRAKRLAEQINDGISKYGVVEHPTHGKIYAYEVDGLGNHLLMDDANIPSLMSIPYLGYKADPAIYESTRRFVLSRDNPTYHESGNGAVKGFGSPHTNANIPQNVWPMGQITQGLTSEDLNEKLELLRVLMTTDAGTGLMHESYDVNNPMRYTRKWFAWANSLFAEFVMSMTDSCPG